MALNGLMCADVPLMMGFIKATTHSLTVWLPIVDTFVLGVTSLNPL